jgi:uncharacterized protein YPO0396
MNFRTFDLLFATVVALAAVAAGGAFFLVQPYPAIIAVAFAAGAATFLYITVRVKFGGIMETVETRLSDQEYAAASHKQVLDKSFAEIDNLTRAMREQIIATGDKNVRELTALRDNVNAAIGEFNQQLVALAEGIQEVKKTQAAAAARLDPRLTGLEKTASHTAASLKNLADNFNEYVADEQTFRDAINRKLGEKVAYLEDFIREKRKSLQI